MLEFIVYVAFGLSVLLAYLCFKETLNYLFIYRKSDFTGYWRNSVFNNKGEIVKVDYCHLLHDKRTGIIKGYIARQHPEDQDYRRWHCNGVLVDQKIIMSFWSVNDTTRSDGCGYLFLTDDWKFEGVYIHGTKDNDIGKVKVISEKVRNPNDIKKVQKTMNDDAPKSNSQNIKSILGIALIILGIVITTISIMTLIPPLTPIVTPVYNWVTSSALLASASTDAIVGILFTLGVTAVSSGNACINATKN